MGGKDKIRNLIETYLEYLNEGDANRDEIIWIIKALKAYIPRDSETEQALVQRMDELLIGLENLNYSKEDNEDAQLVLNV